MSSNLVGLKSALKAWEGASFSELQAELDETSRAIATGQSVSKEARKKLSDMTKSFRKAADEQKLVDVKSLLKAYQTEIDNLTKRTKSSETLILKMCTKVGDLPDPAPILTSSLAESQGAASQEEVNLELETKLKTANNSIQQLREKLQEQQETQKKFDALLEEQVYNKQMEMQADFELSVKNAQEREENLKEKVRLLSLALEDQEKSHSLAQAKLLEGSVQGADMASSHLSQLELVLGELERARDHASALGRENEGLRRQIQTSGEFGTEGAVIIHTEEAENLQLQLEKQEKELTRMLDQLDAAKKEKTLNEKTSKELISQLQSQIKDNETQVKELSSRLNSMSDYQKIKNELEILKYVEFPEEADQPEKFDSATATLVRKAKSQQQTITQLQNDHRKAQADLADALTQLQTASSQIQSLTNLNARLESDLLSAPQNLDQEAQTPKPTTPNGGLLPIVTSQRDRFRARNLELEESVRAAQDEVSELQKTVSALRADNLQLYEQTKYAGAYPTSPTSSQAAHTTLSPEVYKDVSDRYGSIYDEAKNPFQEFRQRETTRRYKTLNTADRAALSLMRMFLANHVTRMILVIYLLSLHLLVIYTLFHFARSPE